ncbi:MAG: TauD/TfdA dioxygenase family protein [Lautropia sp.]
MDLAMPLAPETIADLRRSIADRGVLVFRDQQLSVDQQIEFARQFGRLYIHPTAGSIARERREVIPIHADEKTKVVFGEDWHTDASCDLEPPLGSILKLTEVPEIGGDTLFASMYAAYEALSAPIKRLLEGLTAVHDGALVYRGSSFERREYPRNRHPVICVHPESGRKLIFVNSMYVSRIVGLSPAESDAVLQMLFRHIARPEFQCQVKWREHTVVFWDNRCVQHMAVFDYFPQRRVGTRVQICGTQPTGEQTVEGVLAA